MKEILTVEKLRKIRKRKGMTQAEFAGLVGYSETYIQKLEQGQKPITSEFTNNLLKALDLEKAYRKACSQCCEVHEKAKRGKSSIKDWIFRLIFVLFWILCLIFAH
jgi:DNA-binding helix-turn-helix protein